MSAPDDSGREAKDPEYGRPPKTGQFRAGQSGNPRGRPRKKAAEPTLEPGYFATRNFLRTAAARTVFVNDASGRHEVSISQGIILSLCDKAMRGGVFAQRTVLKYLTDEEARHHAECQERFDLWSGYRERCKAVTEQAQKAGLDAPDFLPHPDDVELDWRTLTVNIRGAIDEEGRAHEIIVEKLQAFAYEMLVYRSEPLVWPDRKGGRGWLGLYSQLYQSCFYLLPPRLRRSPADLEKTLQEVVMRGEDAWVKDLKSRAAALQLPFGPCRANESGFAFSEGKSGMKILGKAKMPAGALEAATAQPRAKRRRVSRAGQS